MFRTFAVLLLLLGLATATPVVCLCAPTMAAANAAGLTAMDGRRAADDAATADATSPSRTADAPSLLATSAAAVVASLMATAGGLPSMAPWSLPQPAHARWRPAGMSAPPGPAHSPTVPPPR